MSIEADKLMTIQAVAERLQVTPDGVYKLIQRGKLEAVKISERKTRIPASAFERYMRAIQGRADAYLEAQEIVEPDVARQRFEEMTGMSATEWLDAWKRDEIEDTAENMELLVAAAGLRAGTISSTSR